MTDKTPQSPRPPATPAPFGGWCFGGEPVATTPPLRDRGEQEKDR